MTAGNDIIVCIASGPSLCREDCEAVEASGLYTIAVNTSWRMAVFCKAIYASDAAWWHAYGIEIDIPAERWSCSQATDLQLSVKSGWNSGASAIRLAILKGAKKVILLGYDCSLANGVHWHGNHNKTKNPTPDRLPAWHAHFKELADSIGIDVVNCSRHTELTCFRRASLESELC